MYEEEKAKRNSLLGQNLINIDPLVYVVIFYLLLVYLFMYIGLAQKLKVGREKKKDFILTISIWI